VFFIEPLSKVKQSEFLLSLSPFPRGGVSRDVKNHGEPWRGHAPFRAKAGEPYQNFDGEGFPSESIKSLAKDWRGI
jgi:hypothetical protein